jgi:hypothetical protein
MSDPMKKHYQKATLRLHEFLADAEDLNEEQLRTQLKAEGADVDDFLSRLKEITTSAEPKLTTIPTKPTASERLKALASRAKQGVRILADQLSPSEETPEMAYGRSGQRKIAKKKPSDGISDAKGK